MSPLLKQHLTDINKMLKGPEGSGLWDILTGLRGPDSPSERPNMSSSESSAAYSARRKRKRETVEAIRGFTFPGIGGARYRTDEPVVYLPPSTEWDHFDKHVARAAQTIGLKVAVKGSPKSKEVAA